MTDQRATAPVLLPQVQQFCERNLKCLIGGEFVSTEATFDTTDPSNGKLLARIPRGSAADIDAAVNAASWAFNDKAWREMSVMTRAALLWKLADLIEKNAAELAQLETLDNGKSIRESESIDIPGAALWFRYYSGAAPRIAGETFPMTVPGDWHSFTLREPVGVVGAIIPWNFPLVVAAWKLAPALACGCTVVLKPAEETSLTCLRLAELVVEAGFPAGVVNVVTGYGEEAGATLAGHPLVNKISFTGSTEVGRKIVAASQENFKRLTLELGGKSANVIFADSDVATAVKVAGRAGIFRNQGQICSAGSRVLVERKAYDQAVEEMVKIAKSIKIGAGIYRDTQMGPLVSSNQRDRVQGFVDRARSRDKIQIVAGGGNPDAFPEGYFIEPTVLANVEPKSEIAQEEVFGPVVAMIPFDDDEHAIAIANDTKYALAAGVWTADLRRAHRMVKRLKAGTVWVNTYNMIDVTTPWGGKDASGIGREHGTAAIEAFTEIKTGVVALR